MKQIEHFLLRVTFSIGLYGYVERNLGSVSCLILKKYMQLIREKTTLRVKSLIKDLHNTGKEFFTLTLQSF